MTEDCDKDDDYSQVRYLQFQQGGLTHAIIAVLGVLTWPVVWPLAMLARLSDVIFRSVGEFLSLMPYFPGVILRYEFYRFALRKCGRNVLFEFGTVLIYSDIAVGSNVLIGRYSIIHHCDIGDDVLVGERCTFLSGMRQHNHDRTDIPMSQQGGANKRISIGNDCWIGSHSVVMENVAGGSIVGAASVVTKPLPEYSVAVGNPARVIRSRKKHN